MVQKVEPGHFEKFGQAESEHRRLGTGLGLTFFKLAMEAHGGSIGVIRAPSAGSTFWCRLPNTAATVKRSQLTFKLTQNYVWHGQ